MSVSLIKRIKTAVDQGYTVYSGNSAYEVKKASNGDYNIVCSFNGYTIGLHGREGTEYAGKLNGDNFYIKLS
jgi:hypothetical protein